MDTKRIVVGITGATGAVFGLRLLDALSEAGIETHLVVSRWGQQTVEHECGVDLAGLRARASVFHGTGNMAATISSGSFHTDGMVIAPCSMKTLAAVAHAHADDLVSRAADVVLKERRRLVLLPREAPLNLAHLRNMVQVTEMGGVVFPPVPAFYSHAKTVDELVNHTVGRVLDLFGVEHDRIKRWQGMKHPPSV